MDQPVPVAFNTALSFDSVRYDNGGLYAGAFPTRLTAPVAGKYLIIGQSAFNNPITTGNVSLSLQVNGITTIAAASCHPPVGVDARCQVSTIYELGVGDYVELFALQFSGGPISALASLDWTPDLMMTRVDS